MTPDEWWEVEEQVIDRMDTESVSEHLVLELAAVFHRGRSLDPGAPVPGCACPGCTGVAEDHPARRPPKTPRTRRRDLSPALDVDAARAVPVAEVARRLGLGEPVRRGRELAVRCPLHEDMDPSLRIAAGGHRWFCDPCGEGGDAIALLMRARGLDFVAAVRELTGRAAA